MEPQDQKTTRWWWVRHAPVTERGNLIYGNTDPNCDCSDADTFASLARRLPDGAVWLTSHLRRTTQTAEAIGRGGKTLPELLVDPDLAEQNLGEFHGVDRHAHHATRTDPFVGFWINDPEERAPGGESFGDLSKRVSASIERWSATYCGRDIVCVAHGGTILAALGHALEVEPRKVVALSISNLSLTRLHRLENPLSGGPRWRVAGVAER